MTDRFVSVRRIVAFSVAITLVAAPIASAQTPRLFSPTDASGGPMLLSPTAFARLVLPPPADVGPAPVVAGPTRPSLLRLGTATIAGKARAAAAKAPQQKSWASRHKVALGVLIGVGAFLGVNFAMCAAGHTWEGCNQ